MFRARPAGSDSAVDGDGRPVRASRRRNRRDGARGTRNTGGFAAGAGLLARVVNVVVAIVVFIIVAGILLVVLKANASNGIVSQIHDWARSLAGPFDGMFSLHSADATIAVNWGIAAVVYLFVGRLIAGLIDRSNI
jgi:hypothetical protein